MTRLEPLRFRPSLREKVWGTNDLAPVLGRTRRRIGEAWCLHDGSEVAEGTLRGHSVASLVARFGERLMGPAWNPASFGRTPGPAAAGDRIPAAFPILGKLLFAAGQLSIQVHPDDEQARALEGTRGKTELWYVVDARPGAELGLGTVDDLDRNRLAEASLDGGIVRLMRWVPARKGQCVLVPAGTVHSIRNGAVLCEIQQNADITYRFYDHGRRGLDGRPRQLQIPQAVASADTGSRPEVSRPQPVGGGPCRLAKLGQCRHFAVELLSWDRPFLYSPDPRRCQLLVFVRGIGSLDAVSFEAGDAFLVPAEAARFPVDGERAQAVRAYLP